MLDTNADHLRDLWKPLGLAKGMTVLCHSFLPSLGRLITAPSVVVETLVERLGEDGVLVAPTFTYSYFRQQVYDVERSPSTVGVLGDLVRAWPSAVRSLDPNFSMAAIGNRAESFMRRETIHSFGSGSIYEKLMQADLRILLLGVDYTALPLFMHLEKLRGVSYRYDKLFTGVTRSRGSSFADSAIHYVRDLDTNPTSHRMRVGALIDVEPDCVRRQFRYGEHRVVPASTVARVVAEQLAKDPSSLIKEPVGQEPMGQRLHG